MPDRRRAAVALAYSARDAAPRVVAKGEGWLADEIVAVARAAGIPVRDSSRLAPALLRVDVGSAIPPALFVAVAEVLAHLARLDRSPSHPPAEKGRR